MATARGVVPLLWPGETFVCIGSGPSLTPDDVAFVRGKARVIAVNDAYRLAPWADVLYGYDWQWWEYHDGVPSFVGLKFTCGTQTQESWNVMRLQLGQEYGLSDDDATLNHGKNSGYQAINLAVHLGARRIVLLGYDMQKAPDGRTHWFGDHPSAVTKRTRGMCFDYWRTCFDSLVKPFHTRGIEVVNCSRQTALTCFPQMALEEALTTVPA